MSSEKTEQPSDQKIREARKKGQVFQSRDITQALAFLTGAGIVAGAGTLLVTQLAGFLRQSLQPELLAALLDPAFLLERTGTAFTRWLILSLPVAAALALVTGLTIFLQVKSLFSLEIVQPKFEKLNPLTGLQRVFSVDQLTDTLKASFLALLLGMLGALYLWQFWMEHVQMLAMPLPIALGTAGTLLRNGLLLLVGLLAAFALVDVPLQRLMLARRLRMSVQEVKQEHKETEGNAEVKGRMRAKMRELASRRMLAAVPQADLVVMNPTHFAVALKYDESAMGAPRVVAKGADLLALKIRDLAKEHKVPVLQSPPLARALYAHSEIDQEIPARLFSAVAQVLAWVYQLRDAAAQGRMVAADAPTPEVPADLDPLNPAYAAAKLKKFPQEPEL